MTQKILVVGGEGANNALLLARLREKHGDDIVLFTPEEVEEIAGKLLSGMENPCR